MNRAPAAWHAVSNASVSTPFNNSTVTKAPLLPPCVSPSGSGKLGQSPSASCAKSIQPLVSGDDRVKLSQLVVLPRGVVAIAPDLRKCAGPGIGPRSSPGGGTSGECRRRSVQRTCRRCGDGRHWHRT